LTRAFAWLVVTWQRIRTAGGVSPSTITMPLANHREAATDLVKVLVNALRAVHRVAGTLIRWLVARATVFPASAVVMFWVPSRRSTPQYGHRSGPSGSNGSRNQNQPGATDPGPQSGQNRFAPRKPCFQDQQAHRTVRLLPLGHLSRCPATFSGRSN
jgi:hypothetical protein